LAADPLRAANEAVGQQIAAMLLGKKAQVVSLSRKASAGSRPQEACATAPGGVEGTLRCLARRTRAVRAHFS
jgi:hypothetical protein